MDLGDIIDFLDEVKENYLLTARTIELSDKLIETLVIIDNCNSCRDNINADNEYQESINEIEYYLAELEGKKEKEEIINELNYKLFEIDDELNSEILCNNCIREIEILTNKCGSKEMAKFFCYEGNLYGVHVEWISFNEGGLRNIEYLAN